MSERVPDLDERWCDCGLAANDPNHGPWHKLLSWNTQLFGAARFQREANFEKDLAHHDYLAGRDQRPAGPQGDLF